MKIGYDAKRIFHNSTGLGNYSRDLIRILSSHYKENNYFLYNPKPKKINTLAIDGNLLVEKIYSGLPFFSVFWRLFSILKSLKKDKIDIFHGLSGEIPIGLKRLNIKSIVTIHDLIFIRYPKLYGFIDYVIYYLKYKYACKNSNLIVAISEQTKKDIISFFGIPEEKIKIIYQGCDSIFKEETTNDKLLLIKQKYNLPNKFILNVGTIEERKNILTAIQAVKNTEVKLVVIGKKTAYFNIISKYISENSMQNQIVFLENIPLLDLSIIYKLSTVFIYPSLFEGFGIPIIEALYSRTPVITSTGSCFSEAGGVNTIYIDPFDVAEFKKSILFLLENEEDRQKQIQLGFDFVQKFNDTDIANNWIKTYKSL
jgi:glycosyltransferase involved in cell wall biosynthesis